MKFLKRFKKQVQEPEPEQKMPTVEETDIKILDNLIAEVFDIDEHRALELENKTR
ncbi:MAG: hypothetical protein JSW33_04835 [bacterium]|nr:MAG: hypothetical protein JSW33_04835 [bacterium]